MIWEGSSWGWAVRALTQASPSPLTDAAEIQWPHVGKHPSWRASHCSHRKQSGFICRRLGLQPTAAYSTFRVTALEAAGLGTRVARTHSLAAGLESVCRALGGEGVTAPLRRPQSWQVASCSQEGMDGAAGGSARLGGAGPAAGGPG